MRMKDYFNLRKSKLLLFALLATFAGGVSPAWAQTTEEFSTENWPEEWSLSTEATEADYYIEYDSSNDFFYPTGRRGVYGEVGSGTTKYIITPVVNGSGSFKFKRRNSSNGSVYVYTYDNGVLGSNPIASNTSKPSSWTTVSFSGVDNMRLAIVLNGRMDDFTYTLGTESSCKAPKNLTATEVTDESSTIIWDAGEADTWNLRYKAADDADYTEVNSLTTNSYDMASLDAATTYTVEVQTVCSAEEQSSWASVEFITPLCSPSVQKTISYTLADSYNDGWNGASITITDVTSGSVIATLTLTSGSSLAEGTVALCPNREYSFTWTKGSYDGECSYTIKDVDGNDLYTLASSSSPTAGAIGDNYSWSDTPVEGAKFAIDKNTYDFGVVNVNDAAAQTFTITNSGNAPLPVTFTDATDFYVAKTVKFTKPTSWSGEKLYIYAWDSSDNNLTASWPGDEVTVAAQNEYSQWVYTASLPKGATGVIFNDGTNQTSNISTADFKDIVGIYLDGTNPVVWQNEDFSVPAGGSASFYVRMVSTTAGVKSGNITLSYTAVNGTETVIPVSGTVMPEGAEVVDFNEAIPARWTNSGWSISSQAASSGSNGVLTTQKLDFSSDDAPFFIMKVKSSSYASGDQITIEGSADNGQTWTAFDAIVKSYNNGDFGNSSADYSTIIISIPNTVNKLRFTGKYVLVDEIIGLKYSDNDPVMSIYTDAECTVAAATSVTKAFDFVTAAPEATKYYIKNDGTGTMTLSLGEIPAGFTASLDNTSVAAGEKATLTINIDDTKKGYHDGSIVVTATDLGSFTVAVSGVMVDENKLNLNFATDNIPATWTTNTNWEKGTNCITTNYSSSASLETATLTATAGEQLVVVARNTTTGSSYTFGVKYKKVDAEEWSDLIAAEDLGTTFKVLVGTIAEAGDYQLQFNGGWAEIQRIYGLVEPAAPAMVVYDGEDVAAATFKFAKVTDEAAVTHDFTVKNEGKAALTGLAVALSGTNADDYTAVIADNKTELAAGESATITVTQKAIVGTHSATLTISATGLDSKEIALSGETKDHTVLDVDFDTSGEWPAGWQAYGNWSVYYYKSAFSEYGNAQHTGSDASSASSLITAPLTIAATTDKLQFQAQRYGNSNYQNFTVRYTRDGGVTWTDYVWGTDAQEQPITNNRENITSSAKDFEITGLEAGTVAFDFYGNYLKLDNFTGDLKVAAAPMLTLTEGETAVASGSTKEFENLRADGVATYTLANKGNADMVSTVAVTGGATVAISGEGEGVTISENTVTLAAGKSATITLTVPFASPYADMSGDMTITTEGWVGDVTVSYTATLVDPTSFVEDFTDGKPAGWYSDGWTFANGVAYVYSGVDKPMITELVGAESGKNTLSFDAKVYSGSDDQTLNVYTSADRKTWSEAQTFTVTADGGSYNLDALADGNYYVKFEASNVTIDNIKGVKKLDAPEHDLYYVSTTWPAGDVTPGSAYNVTVNVASLRADETVAAELYFGETKVAELTEQAISNGATKSFALNGTAPAAGTYDVYAKVYNADASVETEKVSVTVADTRILNITAFTRTSDAEVVADENNEFTATFNVTVQNTGTATLDANEVSVTLTDGTNAYEDATVAWTAASSQTVFLNPGDYLTDAKMVLYEWNTDEDGQWVEFTQISDNFYSAELNGKQNFIIARAKTDATVYGFDNESLYNQSADLSIVNGNIYGYNGYNGDVLNLTTSTMASLAPNVSTTLKVSVTLTAEQTSYSFKAQENVGNTTYFSTQSVSVTPYATVTLSETETYDATAASYGKVTLTRPFIAGWNTLVLPFDVDAETFAAKFGNDAALYTFTANNSGELTFTKTTDGVTAGTPYLLSLSAAISDEMEFAGVTVQPGTSLYMHNVNISGVEFKGNYAYGFDMEGKYGVTPDGLVKKGASGSTMKAFRAYITLPANTDGVRIAIFDETSGISRVLTTKEVENLNIFNMKGQKVDENAKGVVIKNGKKQIVK